MTQKELVRAMTKNGKKKKRLLRRMTPKQAAITVTAEEVSAEWERIASDRSMWAQGDDVIIMPSFETVQAMLMDRKLGHNEKGWSTMSGLISEEFSRKLIGMGWERKSLPKEKSKVMFSKGMTNYTITPNWHCITVGFGNDLCAWVSTSFVVDCPELSAESHYLVLIDRFKNGIDSSEAESIDDLENQIAMIKSWAKEAKEFILSQEDGE